MKKTFHPCYLGTVDTATGAFRRVHSKNEENVTVVKQMSRAGILDQPTIAIITAHYFEKMAVDAVMRDRQTFVKYATVGKYIIPTFNYHCDQGCVCKAASVPKLCQSMRGIL